MTTVLTWLTVGYVVILVLVLAATLITVLWALWSTGSALGKVAEALIEVERNSAPLEGVLVPVNEGLVTVAGALVSARDHLAATDAHLAGVVPTEPAVSESLDGALIVAPVAAPSGART